MRALHALMMLLGALAVLMTGAAPASAWADASPAPCHETATHQAGAEAPASRSGKSLKAMDCCVACVAAPAPRPPTRARLAAPPPAVAAPPTALPVGERPAPEPHPPRPLRG